MALPQLLPRKTAPAIEYMPKRKRKAVNHDNRPAVEDLRNKVLKANFSEFPGDVGEFDDDKLSSDALRERHELEQRLAKTTAFAGLEDAFDNLRLRPAVRRALYRWFCLQHFQNGLRGEWIKQLEIKKWDLMMRLFVSLNDQSEGMAAPAVFSVLEGKGMPSREELERFHQNWLSKKAREERELNCIEKEELEQLEKKRKRSWRRGASREMIDWTRPHTVLEYVDGLWLKRAHGRAVSQFLRGTPCQRRGCGRNKPLEYAGTAGIRLFEHAMTEWTSDADDRKNAICDVAKFQVSLPTALSPEALKFRAVLDRLVRQFPECAGSMSFLETDEKWKEMHERQKVGA
jgi:hypothetical protein